MDYQAWAAEYEQEAEKLQERIQHLKKTPWKQEEDIQRRIGFLTDMYYDCRNIAAVLRKI